MKRKPSHLLSLALTITFMALGHIHVFADSIGKCGPNLHWLFRDIDSTLTITGSGTMYDYSGNTNQPWYNIGVKHLVLSDNLTRIGDYAFAFCSELQDISGGKNISDYGKECFNGCWALRNYTIPRNTIRVDKEAFRLTGIKTLRLDSITFIGEYAFCSTQLDSVFLPDCLTTIENAAFADCQQLQYIRLPNNLRYIPSNCFFRDSSLLSITIPDSVETLEDGAFYEAGILDLTLPATMKSIGSGALALHSPQHLKALSATPPSCHELAFSRVIYDTPVYVPCASIGAYRNATGWKNLTHYITQGIGVAVFGADNPYWGSVTVNQDCNNITLTAHAKEHYHFAKWSNGKTDNPYSFTQSSDTAVYAIFEIDRFRITFLNSDSSVLRVDSVEYNAFPENNDIPIHPSNPDRYRFYGWIPKFVRATKDTFYIAEYSDLTIHYDGLCFHAIKPSYFWWRYHFVAYEYPNYPQISRDGQHWEKIEAVYNVVSLNTGDSIFIRGRNKNIFNGNFVMQGAIMATGSIMSLIDTTLTRTDVPEDAFNGVFKDCQALYTAPELPATALKDRCYKQLFSGCTNLRAAPFLPATDIGNDCYEQMFSGCSSLTYVDVAFSNWTSSDGASPFTSDWLSDVADSGVFIMHSPLPAIEDSSHIPSGWRVSTDTTLYIATAASDHGHVLGSGQFHEGYPLILAVIPQEGYHFRKWNNNSVNNPLFVTLHNHSSYYAYCSADINYNFLQTAKDELLDMQNTLKGDSSFIEIQDTISGLLDWITPLFNFPDTAQEVIDENAAMAWTIIYNLQDAVQDTLKRRYKFQLDNLLQEGDSEACVQIISDAKDAIDMLGFNASLSFSANMTAFKAAADDILLDADIAIRLQRNYDILPLEEDADTIPLYRYTGDDSGSSTVDPVDPNQVVVTINDDHLTVREFSGDEIGYSLVNITTNNAPARAHLPQEDIFRNVTVIPLTADGAYIIYLTNPNWGYTIYGTFDYSANALDPVTTTESSTRKTILNGRLLIRQSDHLYTPTGIQIE